MILMPPAAAAADYIAMPPPRINAEASGALFSLAFSLMLMFAAICLIAMRSAMPSALLCCHAVFFHSFDYWLPLPSCRQLIISPRRFRAAAYC